MMIDFKIYNNLSKEEHALQRKLPAQYKIAINP